MQTGAEDEKVVIDKRINEIIRRMVEINDSLKSIEVYERNNPALLESTYNPIGKVIESFFTYINKDAVSSLTAQGKKALYEGVFDKIHGCELLFVAEDLLKIDGSIDADMLLVCASRASRERKSFLFLCDTALIRNILETGAQIPNVVNLGILHHYTASRKANKSQKKGEEQETMLTGDSYNAATKTVEEVLSTIPHLINKNIQNKGLKVVLRCCSGGQLPRDLSQDLPLTKVYPLGLLPAQPLDLANAKVIHPHLSDSFGSQEELRDAIFKEACNKKDKILVRQDEGSTVTQIFLPNTTTPLCMNDCPILKVTKGQLNKKDKEFFLEFSKKLIILLNEHFKTSSITLYIDPFQVSLVAGQCYENQNPLNQGVKLVRTSFKSLLKEWEKPSSSLTSEALQGLSVGKKDLRRFFAPANSLKDAMCIHKDTYAGQLLAAIKGEYVDVFKTYYGGYNAYKDRMVQESDKDDISDPKSIIVTRANEYMDPVSVDGAKAEPSKGVGGGPKP